MNYDHDLGLGLIAQQMLADNRRMQTHLQATGVLGVSGAIHDLIAERNRLFEQLSRIELVSPSAVADISGALAQTLGVSRAGIDAASLAVSATLKANEEIHRALLPIADVTDRLSAIGEPLREIAAQMKNLAQPSFQVLAEIERIRPSILFTTELAHSLAMATDPLRKVTAELGAWQVGAFRLPERSELALLEDFSRNHAAVGLAGMNADFGNIARLAAGISQPWVAVDDPFASFAGFTSLAALGAELQVSKPFGATLTNTLRDNLGDWRGVTVETDLVGSQIERSASYYSRGFDPLLTTFSSDAFDAIMQHLGVAAVEPPPMIGPYRPRLDRRETRAALPQAPADMQDAYAWIAGFESHIRAFIDRRMTASFGPHWIKQRVPGDLWKRWEERRQADRDAGMPEAPLIAYADFTDYVSIILRKDDWRDIFAAIFERPTFIEESFNRLQPFRLCIMHSRILIEEDKLLLQAELTRLMRAIQDGDVQA